MVRLVTSCFVSVCVRGGYFAWVRYDSSSVDRRSLVGASDCSVGGVGRG